MALDPFDPLVRINIRERRLSLAGVPDLFRTHRFLPAASIDADAVFPGRSDVITLRTKIEVTGASPTGIIFCMGDATAAAVAWIDGQFIYFRAGGAASGAEWALATYDYGSALPVGLRADLIFSIFPGTKQVRIWLNGVDVARGVSTNPFAVWTADAVGVFGAAAPGALSADVTQTGAPTNFAVVAPLEVYFKQLPRQFLTADDGGTAPSPISGFSADIMAFGTPSTPFIGLYEVDGFAKLTNPSTLPTGVAQVPRFSPNGALLAVPHQVTPFVTIYNTSDWSKVADPSTLPTGSGNAVAWSPDGSLLAVTHNTTPFITIYNTSDWSKVTDPVSLPASTGLTVKFSNDGSLLVVGHLVTPFFTIYNTSDWSKVTDPASLPTGSGCTGADFSPDDSLLVVSNATTPYIYIYNTSDWSRVSDPSSLPAGNTREVAFSPDGAYLALAHSNSPYLTVYNVVDWSKRADPATLPPATFGVSVSWAPGGELLGVGCPTTPYFHIYTFPGLVKLDDPSVLLTSQGRGPAFRAV